MKIVQRCGFIFLCGLCGAAMPTVDVASALSLANDLEAQGALDAARRQLRLLIKQADAPLAEDVALRVCALWQRQKQQEVARRCYLDLASTLGGAEARACARYRAAALAVEDGAIEAGRLELTRLVDDLPYTDGGRRAFVLARALHRESGGPSQETEFLLDVASRLAWVNEPGAHGRDDHAQNTRSRALLAEALVEVGRIRLTEWHDPAGANRMLQRAMPAARGTVWEDDALIWLARAVRHLGQHSQALELYHELVSAQQAAWAYGVHFSPLYDEALYEIGQTLEEEQRFVEAQQAYGELFTRTPSSRLLDDAAYRIAQITARRERDPAALQDFVEHYPQSRHVRAARSATLH